MTVDILFSGSRGNCTLIRNGSDAILIDCGKSARAVCASLKEAGCDISDISAVFVTHEHSDHVSALEAICSRHAIPVHITETSLSALGERCRFKECAVPHPTEYSEKVGSFTVTSFPLPHDSACHVGYVIEDSAGDVFGVATDMGHVTERACSELSRCRRVMIESNHDVEMLLEGPYPPFLKRRILSKNGHLSNADSSQLACTLADGGCRVIALAHLSPENNVPSVAYADARCALDSSGHTDCELVVADRDFTVRLPEAR